LAAGVVPWIPHSGSRNAQRVEILARFSRSLSSQVVHGTRSPLTVTASQYCPPLNHRRELARRCNRSTPARRGLILLVSRDRRRHSAHTAGPWASDAARVSSPMAHATCDPARQCGRVPGSSPTAVCGDPPTTLATPGRSAAASYLTLGGRCAQKFLCLSGRHPYNPPSYGCARATRFRPIGFIRAEPALVVAPLNVAVPMKPLFVTLWRS